MLNHSVASLRLAVALLCTAVGYVIGNQCFGLVTVSSGPSGYLPVMLIVSGLGGYAIYLNRIAGAYNVLQVVPDRVREALDTLSEGLLIMDEQERIVLANRAFSETVELSQQRLIGTRASMLPWVRPANHGGNEYPWTQAIVESAPQSEQLVRYRRPDGGYRFFSINATPVGTSDSPRRGALATFRDVTEVEEHRAEMEQMLAMLRNSRDEISSKNRELEILARQDALTLCLNRRALFERFESVWVDAKRNGTPIACLMVDNDHFKQVNDTYGHAVGDEVLRHVANALRESFTEPAMVSRYGGEEFCVVLPGLTLEQAVSRGESARKRIENIRLADFADLRLTASLGISDLRFGAHDPQELINQADKCLYVAKNGGRNQVVTFSDEINAMSIEETAMTKGTELAPEESTGLPFHAVTALVSALAYRDSETAEHSRRVADLCVRVAAGFLDQRNTYILEIAALLHDIGKIGVPDNVLLKPGPLTPQEWKLMRRHDRVGVEIVAGTFNCPELSDIIQTHHAYYGGRDRDSHLPTGKDIPLAARILNIADSYDSMVSDRVYRKGRTHEEAIRELRRCAGTQFDPLLVEHFASMITARDRNPTQTKPGIPKQTAMQIGLQIERLADALDTRDVEGLHTLASRLGAMARHHRIESIAAAAEKIEADAAQENMQWINLLRDTQLLLDLCRSTQNVFLNDQSDAVDTG